MAHGGQLCLYNDPRGSGKCVHIVSSSLCHVEVSVSYNIYLEIKVPSICDIGISNIIEPEFDQL